jgi:hypothetical protein
MQLEEEVEEQGQSSESRGVFLGERQPSPVLIFGDIRSAFSLSRPRIDQIGNQEESSPAAMGMSRGKETKQPFQFKCERVPLWESTSNILLHNLLTLRSQLPRCDLVSSILIPSSSATADPTRRRSLHPCPQVLEPALAELVRLINKGINIVYSH